MFFSDGKGNPATPPADNIYNPDPQSGTLNLYTQRAQWFNCSDVTQPGIAAITNYLSAAVSRRHEMRTGAVLAGRQRRSCIHAERSWAERTGGSADDAAEHRRRAERPQHFVEILRRRLQCRLARATRSTAATATSAIRSSTKRPIPSMVADHMRDVTDLFTDLENGTLPAVSYVKPDGTMDGHPASSKWTLFEAFAQNIVELAQSNPELWSETAIFVTVDEGGGYYDSGFIQPVDFFGTGPRIPMIAVSPYSTGGHISHVYNEHSSFVKFVERNWISTRR